MQASDGPISMASQSEERRNWISSTGRFVRAALVLFCVFLPFWMRAATPIWTSEAGFRFLEVSPPASGKSGFTLLPAGQTGIAFTNELPVARYRTNQILLNGSGIAAGDVDGDGWCDLYFCGIDRPNTLYRNLGNWRFEEVAGKAGVRCEELSSTGAALMDFEWMLHGMYLHSFGLEVLRS